MGCREDRGETVKMPSFYGTKYRNRTQAVCSKGPSDFSFTGRENKEATRAMSTERAILSYCSYPLPGLVVSFIWLGASSTHKQVTYSNSGQFWLHFFVHTLLLSTWPISFVTVITTKHNVSAIWFSSNHSSLVITIVTDVKTFLPSLN